MSTRTPRAGGAVGRRLPWIAFVLLLVVPLLEIATIIGVGRVIGGWQTIVLLLLESLLGAWLVKREGSRTWQALRTALTTGRMPSRELADAALVLIGGTLLLTPGFLTDVVGFFFLAPPTRPFARRVLERAVSRRLLGGSLLAATARATTRSASGGATGTRSGTTRAGADEDVIEGEIL